MILFIHFGNPNPGPPEARDSGSRFGSKLFNHFKAGQQRHAIFLPPNPPNNA